MTIRLNGSTSGFTELDAPPAAGNNLIRLPGSNGATRQAMRNGSTPGTLEFSDDLVLMTPQASTSGTVIDFTGIPSWAKRVSLMFNGVSTNGSAALLVQVGSGSFVTAGYNAFYGFYSNNTTVAASGGTAVNGWPVSRGAAADTAWVQMTLQCFSGNTWMQSHVGGYTNGSIPFVLNGGGSIALAGALDRIRFTTSNGTDVFDAGSVNVMYQ